MLDIQRLRKIRLARRPLGQRVMANAVLRWDYLLPRRTRIVLEGLDNLPKDKTVIFAMNHPDRYNYWPFQFELYRRDLGFTATWVKGKYYENEAMARFMDACNNIPLPSRGYVISTEFRKLLGAPPSREEYRALRDLVDGTLAVDAPELEACGRVVPFLRAYGDGDVERGLKRIELYFADMIREVVRLSRDALHVHGNHLLVFPQGTRSVRLLPGKTGMMQMAWHLGRPVVPVGCNGSERCYPGNSPFSRGGTIVYRIGAPLELDGPELSPFHVDPGVLPMTRQASEAHGERYQAATDVVMEHINRLLDPPYQMEVNGEHSDVAGSERFI